MNKISIAGVFYILMISQAFAENSGAADSEGTLHSGLKLGKSNVASSPAGYGIYAGYTFYGPGSFSMKYLEKISVAAELEATSLGAFNNSSTIFNGTVYAISGVATYPVNEDISFISKAGIARTIREYDCGSFTCRDTSTKKSFGVHLGVAGQYKLTRLMSLRGGYDIYPDGANIISISAVYLFTQKILREKPKKPKMEGVLRIEGIEPSPLFPF
ncbi:MAG: hypothetical protein R8M11_00920 [Gallionella sp.]